MPERPLATLYRDFGNLVADILEHPDCPTAVFERLTDFTGEIDNDAGHRPLKRWPAHARHFVPHCLSLLTPPDDEDSATALPNRAADQPTTKQPAMEERTRRWLDHQEAEALIAPLMDEHGECSPENDLIAQALFKIIQLFAYEDDWVKRDADAGLLADTIYRHTGDFSFSCHRFADKAGLTFGRQGPIPQDALDEHRPTKGDPSQ